MGAAVARRRQRHTSAVFAGLVLTTFQLAGVPPALALAEPREYIGARACRECHESAYERWRGSHHDLAMQVADPSTVLGSFEGTTFSHFGVQSSFSRRDDRYFVRTEGPDGALAEFRVAYTFGVDPLQQYLVELPDGRMQALPFAWDTRAEQRGGQRWFHIYADEAIPAGDPLHWTGPNQNWNHMCADCHSTNLRKRYDEANDRFRTQWSAIDVSCEACHGPASEHVAWARARADDANGESDPHLTPRFDPVAAARWLTDAETALPRRDPSRDRHREVETCGGCHSRRSAVHEGALPGGSLLDSHRVALIGEPIYFIDGQIREEVYVYGSFLQSRMYAGGVTCSDCHDPHSQELRAEGNALCGRCHEPARFDDNAHHHHAQSSAGAQCVGCHMPSRTYMEVDERRDHSLRVPRPDLSDRLGTPNACTSCHADRSNEWAAAAVSSWRGGEPPRRHWGEDLHVAASGGRDASARLGGVIADPRTPAIVRATALSLLPNSGDRSALGLLQAALRDPSPLVRSAAVGALDAADPQLRARLVGKLLTDPVRTVRLEATRVLASVPPPMLPVGIQQAFDAALAEFRAVQAMDADRAEAHLRLGTVELHRGELPAAERELLRARELAPWLTPTAVNLADLYRVTGEDAKGETVLREALAAAPDDGDIRHALGLLLVRRKQLDAALPELERAADLRPDNARYSFVLAVALHTSGAAERALSVLRAASQRHPGDPDIASFRRQLESAP